MAKMIIELDTEDENYVKVSTMDGKLEKKDTKEVKLKISGKEVSLGFVPNHTLIWSFASPGCVNYIHKGQLYRV